MQTVTLFRPVGQRELDLIEASDFKAFPPRLPEQPIFYPVLNEDYAIQITRDWNTQDELNGSVGYVTRFDVDEAYLSRFQVQQVGGAIHLEYWVPAEELPDFNAHIRGPITVIREYR